MTKIPAQVIKAIESIVDGWYSEGRIDWEDFLYRVEKMADYDLGYNMLSSEINAIKRYAKNYQKALV